MKKKYPMYLYSYVQDVYMYGDTSFVYQKKNELEIVILWNVRDASLMSPV